MPFLAKNCWILSMVWVGAFINYPSWNGQMCWKSLTKKFIEAKHSLSQQRQLEHWCRWVPRTLTQWGKPVLQGAHPPEDNSGFLWMPTSYLSGKKESHFGLPVPTAGCVLILTAQTGEAEQTYSYAPRPRPFAWSVLWMGDMQYRKKASLFILKLDMTRNHADPPSHLPNEGKEAKRFMMVTGLSWLSTACEAGTQGNLSYSWEGSLWGHTRTWESSKESPKWEKADFSSFHHSYCWYPICKRFWGLLKLSNML